MKTKNAALISFVVLLSIATTLCAELKAAETRLYMGVWLDTSPLPDLLIKHLGLLPDQGIRITNVHRDSPADKAGLERDDIIIGFEGKKVMSSESQEFIDEVQKAGIGTEVSLEIIHLGQRKTVKLKLEPFEGEREFKYPPEPEIIQSWRPGKIFRLRPGDKDWVEIFFPGMPPEFKVNFDKLFFDKLFKELRTYHHSVGEDYTITIEGNPNNEDTMIDVRIGNTEYRTTVKEIDKLPTKYREAADQALKNAQKSSKTEGSPEELIYIFKRYDIEKPSHPPVPPFGPGDHMFDNIEKQMRKLQERIEELEKRLREAPERLPDKPDKQESQEQEKPAQPENKDRLRV